MGVPVTVDSDDLETLLFATGVVKAMEAALAAAKNDILAKQAAPKISSAHTRINAAWNRAKRPPAEPIIEPLVFRDRRLIEMIGDAEKEVGFFDASPHVEAMRQVRMYGLVEMGTEIVFFDWPDSQDRATKGKRMLARLTPAGRERYEALKAQPKTA